MKSKVLCIEFARRMIVDSIYSSANVEGLGTTFITTECILENIPVKTTRSEVQFIINMKYAWNFLLDNLDYKELSSELGIGEITLKDIVKELKKPGRDPRDEMPEPILRNDVLEMKDLKEGMILKGTVRNVVDFGAFVDIGVHQDGLVHISELVEDQFVKHPLDIVSVGDIVDVRVLSVDLNRNRINLSMII